MSAKKRFVSVLSALAVSLLAADAHAQHLSVQEVPLTANHVLYDSFNGKIYASIPGTAALNPNSVAQINAASGAVEAYIPVGSNPDVLALSSDGSYLYVGIDGTSSVARIVLSSSTIDQQFSLGTGREPAQYTYHAGNIVPLPGLPQSVAVTKDYFGLSPANDTTAIYDNGVQRANTPLYYETIGSLTGSNSASRLYAYDNEDTGFDFYQLNVDANGVTVGQKSDSFGTSILSGFGVTIKFDPGSGYVYATNGTVVDPVALTDVGTYPNVTSGSSSSSAADVVPSHQENRVYFLTGASYSTLPATVASYNQATFQPVSRSTTSAAYNSIGDLYEISPTKFVFRTNTGVEIATPQSASSITVTAASPAVRVGKTDQFTATASYPDGTTSDVTSIATWGSNNASAATINSAGLAQGVSSGTANITATLNGVSSRPFALTVTPANYHVLWNNTDGRASIWNYDTGSGTFTQNTYGPYPGWSAKTIADGGTDGLTRVLWDRTDGAASLWELNNAAGTFTQNTYGPYPGWTASSVSILSATPYSFSANSASTNNLLWNNTDGRTSLWFQQPDDFGSFTQNTYGPYPGWTAKAVADAPDNSTQFLWNNADGRLSVGNTNNPFSFAITLDQDAFGPYPSWTADAISISAASTTHILWNNTDGRMSLWNYDANLISFTQNTYGPYPNWSAKSIADGSDGKTLVLWDNTDGRLSLWSLDNTTGVFSQYTFGPYPGWTATSVSGD